ncbi:MAG: AAA family ATPase [Desulfobulbaceae bacterium]|nr:AAA family ATPase [Desulfobulbaceae bacterium]
MNYLKILNLEKEPFSNSPDPNFFFASAQHMRSLQRLELSIRLRKGLCVVLGEIGTGKTTLCRRLIRRLSKDSKQVTVNLFLDPEFASPGEFLRAIINAFGITGVKDKNSERSIKEMIKQHLFNKGVNQKEITVLILDEGQKLPGFCLEILREFLNYETNQHKLLQIVIFAQQEFREQLTERANFSDRIAEFCTLTPLNFADTRRMILFRLRQAYGRTTAPKLFSFWALITIYRQTGGYPRKIVQLCSQTLLALIIQNKTKVTSSLAKSCSARLANQNSPAPVLRPALLLILLTAISFWQWGNIKTANGIQLAHSIENAFTSSQKTSQPQPLMPPPQIITKKSNIPESEAATTQVMAIDSTAHINANPGQENNPNQRALFNEILNDSTMFPTKPILGKLQITNGDSLSRMIHRVYGEFNTKLLNLVTQNNPQIKDTDLIPAGTEITFPASCSPHLCSNQPGYRLQLGQTRTLAEADDMIKVVQPGKTQPRILPVWQAKNGLTFMILTPTTYTNLATATAAQQTLPLSTQNNSRILHDWEDEYFFVTNNILDND